MHRIEALTQQLRSETYSTIGELAERMGVSTRTIARDIEFMRDSGMSIDADRGRGGGVRLDPHWGVNRVSLNHDEALDLLISIAVAEQMKSPIFMANLGAVRRQLLASFSREKRKKVTRLKSRILVRATSSAMVQSKAATPTAQISRAICQAFVDQEILQIHYQREDGQLSHRQIEPHFLLLKYPVWYLIAVDHLRHAPRLFRCDRVQSAARTGDPFVLRSWDDLYSGEVEPFLLDPEGPEI
jgi:predicted DNA-binding transcriptional regulator YafY